MAKTTFTNLAIKGTDSGTATLVAGTVTVALPSVTANSLVFVTRTLNGGTTGTIQAVVTAGTGFVLTSSSALDTSTVGYVVIDNL